MGASSQLPKGDLTASYGGTLLVVIPPKRMIANGRLDIHGATVGYCRGVVTDAFGVRYSRRGCADGREKMLTLTTYV